MPVARVQARGVVTVPQEVREACSIDTGTELLFVPTGHRTFECRVLPARRPLTELTERFASDGVAPEADEWRAALGEEMARERLDTDANCKDR